MKWNNKGNQLSEMGTVVLERYSEGVYLYGAGILGTALSETLKKYGLCKGFVDNSSNKQGTMIAGLPVISYDEYMKQHHSVILVITMSQDNTASIVKSLLAEGFVPGKDFELRARFVQDILPVLLWYKYRDVFLSVAQISLTERCTLKCKKCAHGCFNVPMDYPDLSFERACASADNFFKYVDFIDEFVLIGGEPLLYKQLSEVVKYIGERYRDKMNIFSITSNGTITPADELLSVCKKYNVMFRISNYTVSLPKLKKQHEKLAAKMAEYDVEMKLGLADHHWMDYGFDYVKRDCDDNELVAVFDACHTPCHEVQDDKFYYCVMAHTVSNNLHFDVGKDDYFLLENLSGEQLEKRKELFLEYTLGYSDKGHLDMCRYCNGAEAKKYLIPVAEQVR